MKNSDKSICQEMLLFDRNVRSIRYHLNAIEWDEYLRSVGWKINYALDFSIIYSYAFGTWSFIKQSRGELTDTFKSEFVQKSAGIRSLLTNNR